MDGKIKSDLKGKMCEFFVKKRSWIYLGLKSILDCKKILSFCIWGLNFTSVSDNGRQSLEDLSFIDKKRILYSIPVMLIAFQK